MKLKHLLLLLMTVVSFSTVRTKAQTYQKYDASTCYSKILIDAKINDFAGNTKPMGFGSYNSKTGTITQPVWCDEKGNKRDLVMDYVAGLVAKACIEAADYYKDFTWSKPWFKLVENYATQVSVPTTGASLDDLNASKMYFAIAELTKPGAKYENSTTYNRAITELKNALLGLKAVNTNFSIRSSSSVNYYDKDGKLQSAVVKDNTDNTKELTPTASGNMNAIGGWYHKATYPNQMWCDSEYMGPALLAQLVAYATNNPSAGIGTVTGKTKDDDWKLIAKQFDITWNYLWNSTDKLLYHGFSATPTALAAHTYTWATGTNGTNAAYWGRAIGWYFLALVDVLENMPENITDNSYTSKQDNLKTRDADIKKRLTSYLTDLAAGIWAQKKSGSNLWTNVINEAVGTEHSSYSSSAAQTNNTQNYLEASASAIYIAAYIKAMRLGLLSTDTYKTGIDAAYKSYINNFITTDNKIINTCASAGLGGGDVNISSADTKYKSGGGKYRNGTADYYTRGYDVTKVTTYQEGKPLGAFILASTEYERFMKDNYAPSFTYANSEKPAAQTITKGQSVTLHAAAMAKPTATYQWYSYSATEAAAASYATRATTTGTKIDGATNSDLTVNPTANTYYYCVATNEKGTAQTDAVLVTVNEASNGGSGSESDVIATFENLTSTAPTSWTAKENNGFTVSGIGSKKDYLNSGLYAVKMSYKKTDGTQEATTITLNVPNGYTVTSLKISAVNSSAAETTEITVNNVEKVTIDKVKTEFKEYEVSLTNPVTGSNTISITNSGGKELGISKIVVLGYQGTPSSLTITTQPEGATYGVNDVSVTPLNVVVSATGISSEISYQWYSNTTNSTEGGTLIQNGPSSTYTPPVTTAGTTYYYCIASAGGQSVTSNVVAVAVLNPSDLKTKYNAAWTPIANGTIEVGNLVTSSSKGAYSITAGNDVATISGTTITALMEGKFTLSQEADDKYRAGSIDITVRIGDNVTSDGTNKYSFTAEKTDVSDGMTITRKDITMTFGNDGFWSQPSADSYTGGQVNPTVPANNIPTAGTFYKFTPTTTGTLAVKVKLGTDGGGKLRPLYVSENGTFITAKLEDGTQVGKGETPAATEAYNNKSVTFPVKANTDYYVYVNSSKLGFYGFTFTPVTLYTVTFNAGSNGTCDTKSIMQESENATITLPSVTANNGYTFDGWYTEATGGTKEGDAGATYTPNGNITLYAHYTSTSTGGGETGNVVTKTGTFPRSEMKTFDGKPDSAIGEVNFISKNANGETVSTGGVLTLSSESPNVQAQQNDKGTKVRLGGSFTITAATGYKIKSIELVTDQSSRNLTSSPDATPERNGTNYTYNFTTGEQSVTFTNNNSYNIYVGVINVTYEYTASGNKTPLTISFSDSQIERFTGDTFTLPTPTVTANGTTDVSGKYTVTYKSNNETIATVNNNQVELRAPGTVAITATVEPTAEYASQYEGGSAVITVVSKAYTPLTVSVADVMMNSNDDAQTNPDVKVYLNDALVATSNYTVSYEVTSGTNVTASGSTLTVGGSAGSYTAGTSEIKVTVTPTEAFKSANHCEAGTATFSYVVNEAGTKLKPVIDFPDAITLSTNVTQTLISYVKYNGVDVTDLFTKKYEITDKGTSTDASFSNATTGEFKTGTTAATVKIKITVTPHPDYADQYNTAEKEVIVNIKTLTELTITKPDDMTAKVGDVLDMPSFTITEKTSGNAVSSDDLDFVINSSSTSVVTVSDDKSKLYAVGAGTATIIVLAKDKTGNTYMDATTEFTVTVTDPSLHIVEKGATALNGQCITAVPNVYMTYGGWVFKEDHTTFLGKKYGTKKWNNAATDAAGAPVGFPYAVMGNGHEDSRDELGASASPEGKTIDYQSKGFELTDKMFSVPAEGAYFVFTPKVNGTVVAHVLQNGVFDPGYNNGKHTPTYKPNRRVFVVDEGGNRMPDNDIIAHLDVTTGKPKASATESEAQTINGVSYTFTKNEVINDVRLYKTDYKDKSGSIYLSENYDFNGSTTNTIDGGIEGFTPTIDKNGIITFQNKIYRRKINKDKDEVKGGYVVLSKAPVTYTFKVKAGKSYYLYCFGSKLSLYGYEFKADESIAVDEVTLSETTAPTLSVTAEGHMAKVSLDRTFKAGIWNACVLPFSLNQYQVDAIFGKTYDKNNLQGTQILYFDRVEGHKIYFRRHAYNTIVAGKPFLIKPTKEAVISSENMGTKFPYVTIEAETPQAEWGRTAGNAGGIGSIDTDYTWVSSYGSMTALPGDYYLNGNGDVSHCTEGHQIPIKGFRGYLKAKTQQAASKVLKLAYDSNVDGDGEATPIEGLVMDREGNLLEVPTSGVVYNLSGQVVTRDADKLYTLPAGIYIVNGKKYIVR